MDLFIALGVELGSWEVNGERCYYVMVNKKKYQLTKFYASVYRAGQSAVYTAETAAEVLEADVQTVQKAVNDLVEAGLMMYWADNIQPAFFETHSLTPRGSARSFSTEKGQSLSGFLRDEPVEIEPFGHSLWLYSNGLATIDLTLKRIALEKKLPLEDCMAECIFFIPYLLRHNLVILNKVK